MAKRARAGDSLTGGSHDINPQYMSGSVTLSAANTYTQLAVQVPVQRISPQRADRALVLEAIRLYANIPELDNTAAAEAFYNAQFGLSTRSATGIQGLGSPTTLAFLERSAHKAFTAGGSYETVYSDPQVFDFTDGAGHGVLVATDAIYLQAITTGYVGAGVFAWKLLYRWKEVSLTEYIGIVQSQQ